MKGQSMLTFGWNDAALYGISLLGIYIILLLLKKDFHFKRAIIYTIFLVIAIAATIISIRLMPDDFGTLVTRSMIFQALSVYFLGTDRTTLHLVNSQNKGYQQNGTS